MGWKETLADARQRGATDFQLAQLDSLRKMPETLGQKFSAYATERIRIAAAPQIVSVTTTDARVKALEARNGAIAKLKAETLSDFDLLRQYAENDVDAVRRAIDERLGRRVASNKDANVELLAVIREQAAWARMRPILKRAPSIAEGVTAIVKSAIASQDLDSLTALREELPAYIDGYGHPATDLPLADQAYERELSNAFPYVGSVLKVKAEVESGWNRAVASFALLRHAVLQDEGTVVIAAWDNGRAITATADVVEFV
jgi:hypothetical protein